MATPSLTVYGLEIPNDIQTLDGFRRWFGKLEEEAPRATFCGGKVYIDMPPQNDRRREPAVDGINRVLGTLSDVEDRGSSMHGVKIRTSGSSDSDRTGATRHGSPMPMAGCGPTFSAARSVW
jgi:hypothetical protein